MEQRLESFLTLCDTMHYGRAAEKLHLSQPAVSKHIQSLENQYGVSFFTYANRRLQKTREGEILQQYVQALRYNEEKLMEKLCQQPTRLLRIGATKSIGEYVLLPNIKRFLSFPENEIEFLVDNTERLLERLDRSELDFVVLEGIFHKQHYDWTLFRKEPYIGICAKDHPFAGREAGVEELFAERIILREKGSGTRNIFERELENIGFTTDAFRKQICISSFELIKSLVSDDYGISFLYQAVIKDNENLAQFSCPPLTGVHEFNAVFLKGTDAGDMVKKFMASC